MHIYLRYKIGETNNKYACMYIYPRYKIGETSQASASVLAAGGSFGVSNSTLKRTDSISFRARACW